MFLGLDGSIAQPGATRPIRLESRQFARRASPARAVCQARPGGLFLSSDDVSDGLGLPPAPARRGDPARVEGGGDLAKRLRAGGLSLTDSWRDSGGVRVRFGLQRPHDAADRRGPLRDRRSRGLARRFPLPSIFFPHQRAIWSACAVPALLERAGKDPNALPTASNKGNARAHGDDGARHEMPLGKGHRSVGPMIQGGIVTV